MGDGVGWDGFVVWGVGVTWVRMGARVWYAKITKES